MIIEIRNFGPVHQFTFDLSKDLHLVVGENNVGKSYAITLVYLLLKSFIRVDEGYRYIRVSDLEEDMNFPPAVSELDVGGETDITDFFIERLKTLMSASLLPLFRDSIAGTFERSETIQNFRSEEPFSVRIKSAVAELLFKLDNGELVLADLVVAKRFYAKKINQQRFPRHTPSYDTVYFPVGHAEFFTETFITLLHRYLSEISAAVTSQVHSVFYLPASRSGLYQALSAFGQIIAELSKSRSFLSKRIELPGISEPLSDYFLKLSEISASRKPSESALNRIARKIESEILMGTVEYDLKTKKIMYGPKDSTLRLDLSAASSMVAELSPVVSYLRYILPSVESTLIPIKSGIRRIRRTTAPGSKSLVVIEEPEAHLHPKVQRIFVEVIGDLIAAGVKVVVTTHSNYMFSQFSNLLISKKLSASMVEAFFLSAKRHGSEAQRLEVDEMGISDPTFGAVSEAVLEERLSSLSTT